MIHCFGRRTHEDLRLAAVLVAAGDRGQTEAEEVAGSQVLPSDLSPTRRAAYSGLGTGGAL